MRTLIFLSLVLSAGRLTAQVADTSPLVTASVAAQTVPGGWIVTENRADRALQSGFPATATVLYRELLADPGLPAETRPRVMLALVTALLDAGELAPAAEVLQAYPGPFNSAYQLRVGLLAITTRRPAQARAALAAGKVEELPAADRGWWYFLEASVTDAEGDIVRANGLYAQAVSAAVSDLQRARFVLGQEQARLGSGQANEAQLATLRGNMERFQGTRTGYTAVRTYAAALAELGRSAEAQAELKRQLNVLPATERDAGDQLRLMLGLIAGEGSEEGRNAFRQLLRDAQRPETRRLALQLLVRGAKTPAEREQLRRDLSERIAALPTSPIIEDLLLVRAQSALEDKEYTPAEDDARRLLENYPATTLKAQALGVRLAVAWDLKRYRTAADVIAQLRAVLPPGRERAELAVLLAEAFFRAEDYRNAADAYDAALREAPLAAPAGILIFQRVLAEIRADRLEAAASQLDEAAAEPAFDAVSRWQAEWNLVREMQVRGQAPAAYARVERLLATGAEGVPPELRIRLQWLRARLAYDNLEAETALRLTDELLTALQSATGLEVALRDNVTSTTRLLKAQALLTLGRDPEGLAVLDGLRADFRDTLAAQYSYLVQAGHLSERGDLAAAQRVLIDFVDTKDYAKSEYAPLALYQAALILERQGLNRQLEEASKLLERLITSYPTDDLVFQARLKQGDLFRKLNDFPNARLVYEYLLNNYAGHPDELLAQLALADSLLAQGANNVSNHASAVAIYERLRDLPSAPPDLRMEAGFKWGYALAKRGQPDRAQTVFWGVVQGFLLEPTAAATLGAKGRYWLSKSLIELAQIHEEAGRLDEAQRAYQLVVDNKLGGAAMAQAKLARFRATGGTGP
ncbi:tetratricopeptide repeat protein [Lacunisphaera limnophila]|uniref:tetratricopeptide repeat protein n=1 Tax=Lacunisphaera limnophila TaxID=1838286 RepID=UPI0012FE56C2|nr:tetratricopeptide repeat protein [Lacunisphaera limnophila]